MLFGLYMKSLRDDLGEECFNDVTNLLEELVGVTINSARSFTNNDNFAEWRKDTHAEYADSIYRTIMRYKKIKRSKK